MIELAKELAIVEAAAIPRDDHKSIPTIENRFKLFDATEALNFDEPVEWLVENLISRGSVITIAGPGGGGKTYAVLDLAVAGALEDLWLGFNVRRFVTLIIDEESGNKRLKRRLRRVIQGHFAEEKLRAGQIVCTSLSQVNLTDPVECVLLHDLVTKSGADLVIIDALVDVSGGADENAARDMQVIYQNLRKIAEETQTAIIVIHHTNKAGDVRGSTAIKNACDLVLTIDKKQDSPNMDIETVKVRDIEPTKFAAILNFSDAGQTWLTLSSTKTDQHFSRPQNWVIDFLKEHGPSTRTAITSDPDTCETRTAKAAIYQLVEKKVIYRTNPNDAGRGSEAIYDLVQGKENAIPF